jgi:hypothetical protein
MKRFLLIVSCALMVMNGANATAAVAVAPAKKTAWSLTQKVVAGLAVVTSAVTLTFMLKPNLRKAAHKTFTRWWAGLASRIGYSAYINLDVFAEATAGDYKGMEKLLRAGNLADAKSFIQSLFSQGRSFNGVEIGDFYSRFAGQSMSKSAFGELAQVAGYVIQEVAGIDMVDGAPMMQVNVGRIGG